MVQPVFSISSVVQNQHQATRAGSSADERSSESDSNGMDDYDILVDDARFNTHLKHIVTSRLNDQQCLDEYRYVSEVFGRVELAKPM